MTGGLKSREETPKEGMRQNLSREIKMHVRCTKSKFFLCTAKVEEAQQLTSI